MSDNIQPPFRVFVSIPLDDNLTPKELEVKHAFMDLLTAQGLEPQAFGDAGLPLRQNRRWTIESADEIMSYCQGAVVFGFPRWEIVLWEGQQADTFFAPTEYSHCEGTLALARQLPTLLIRSDRMFERGIFDPTNYLTFVPMEPKMDWLQDVHFQRDFNGWSRQVKERYHVFIGYSSAAATTARNVAHFLRGNGVRVLDWETGFQSAGTILEQIQRAERECLGGIFLFTKDDELRSGDALHAAPRDNVIFEAGYFINSKGDSRVLIIREEGARMPADVGGQIYLPLVDRQDITPIQDRLLRFINERL